MSNEDLKFKIDQLRKDKIIWAAEMTGVNTAVFIGIFLTLQFVNHEMTKNILLVTGGFFGIMYSIYASIYNIKRHKEIKRLEKELWIKS